MITITQVIISITDILVDFDWVFGRWMSHGFKNEQNSLKVLKRWAATSTRYPFARTSNLHRRSTYTF